MLKSEIKIAHFVRRLLVFILTGLLVFAAAPIFAESKTDSQLFVTTPFSNSEPGDLGPERLEFPLVSESEIKPLLLSLGKSAIDPKAPLTVAVYVPLQMSPEDQTTYLSAIQAQVNAAVAESAGSGPPLTVQFKKIVIDLDAEELKLKAQRLAIENSTAIPGTIQSFAVNVFRERVLALKNLRHQLPGVPRWRTNPALADQFVKSFAVVLGAASVLSVGLAPGAHASIYARAAVDGVVDYSMARWADEFPRFLRTHSLPFETVWPKAFAEKYRKAEITKSYAANLLIWFLARPKFDNWMETIAHPNYQSNGSFDDLCTGVIDLFCYTLSEKGYEILTQKGYLTRPERRYLLWFGGVCYQAWALMKANEHTRWAAKAPLILSWAIQLAGFAAAKGLPAKSNHLVFAHPDLKSHRATLNLLEPVEHTKVSEIPRCPYYLLANAKRA